jgi:hypothetical protein
MPEPSPIRQVRIGPSIPIAEIDAVVAANLGPARVRGNAQPNVLYRQIAMYLCKHVGGWSTTRIGRFYNGRDHSTVSYAIRRIELLRASDAEFDALVCSLMEQCKITQEHAPAIGTECVPRQILNGPIMLGLIDRIAERVMDRLRNGDPPNSSVP